MSDSDLLSIRIFCEGTLRGILQAHFQYGCGARENSN